MHFLLFGWIWHPTPKSFQSVSHKPSLNISVGKLLPEKRLHTSGKSLYYGLQEISPNRNEMNENTKSSKNSQSESL